MKRIAQDRKDITDNLPHGAMVFIAKICGVSPAQVRFVLHGERKQNKPKAKEIIQQAEKMAAINYWNNNLCNVKPTLNPFNI